MSDQPRTTGVRDHCRIWWSLGQLSKVVAVIAVAIFVALLSPTSATADTTTTAQVTWYGAYKDKGTCEYWKQAVAAQGINVDYSCFWYYGEHPGWYFRTYT